MDALDDAALDRLADLLSERLAARGSATAPEDGWLDSRRAADYLGMSRDALHKLTAARAVPFEQEGFGCRCWFKRSDLDAWVRAGRPATRSLRAA